MSTEYQGLKGQAVDVVTGLKEVTVQADYLTLELEGKKVVHAKLSPHPWPLKFLVPCCDGAFFLIPES